MRPIAIPAEIEHYIKDSIQPAAVNEAYKRLRKTGPPEITISVPAYNEEATLTQTLASLCDNITDRVVEIIVVNNNSKDKTEEIIKACGMVYGFEIKQGIAPTRNKGLAMAAGEYVLNADADTIYPKYWIEEMVKPLIADKNISITYGKFSFIPIGSTGRVTYFVYEHFADLARFYDKSFKDEAVNVYGFTSAFRRVQGLQVDGFNFPPRAGEDGYFALKLKKEGFGDFYMVTSTKAIVWTTDRRIQIDGGLWKGIFKRLKRVFG